ncbi:MAG: type II toxin-antitoxin system RelE/ParE family toxin [Cyclobacteriaceae bacterium]|nr:type II toxin-antitoxin system RelE/ParE family toxin [Cyclobacteriaceae bacterium]
MYQSIILPLAKQDIKEAARWYNERSQGLGKRFTHHVREKVKFICQNPTAVAIRYDDTRTAVMDVFPYMIHFTIDEENKKIIISAVLSTHRNPDLWKKR